MRYTVMCTTYAMQNVDKGKVEQVFKNVFPMAEDFVWEASDYIYMNYILGDWTIRECDRVYYCVSDDLVDFHMDYVND